MKKIFFKTIIVCLFLFTVTVKAQSQNFPHINTYGFDYIRFSDNDGEFVDNLKWLANRHDWIVGTKALWPGQGVDYLDALTYNTIKEENPDVKIMKYLPYHSIAPTTQAWLEDWATTNGYNPEDLYYHYDINTSVRIVNSEYASGVVTIEQTNPAIVELSQRYDLPAGAKLIITDLDGSTHPVDGITYLVLPIQGQRYKYYLYTNDAAPQPVDGTGFPAFTGDWGYTTADNGTVVVPGYPNGWAPTKFDSRLRVRWNHGWVGINPSSQTFRKAYRALALYVITLEGTSDTFADGLFLDTFEGLANQLPTGYTSFMENTVELKDIGTKEEIYDKVHEDLATSANELRNFLIEKTGNPSFRLHANPAVPRYIYNTFSGLFNESYRSYLMDLSIEYLVTTTTSANEITYLKQIYDDMDNGRLFFIRSQTNFAPPTIIPFAYTQFILATHYLINHENAHFMYHYGSAGNYGGYPYGDPKSTHWHPNMEVDIRKPVVRGQADYWGETNTDRFFVFAQGADYTILGREYNDALVLSKFANVGGWANIGSNPTTHDLGGEYYPLLADNTNGLAITSITLGTTEGAILLKSPVGVLGVDTPLQNKVQVYPNPVKNVLTINNLEQPIESYKIYTINGQVIQSDSLVTKNQVNTSSLTPGVYLLELIANQKTVIIKFIKE
ncbi:MAG: T9SS type A sorting domain-containing protein [Cyclobacteriaceae bacterium]|nr:T9SS type A sorting domain-containing protein [Cyclobacteriaceae bacterium]